MKTLIFALAMVVDTGVKTNNPLEMTTQTVILPPAYVSSLECQTAARAANEKAGQRVRILTTGKVTEGVFYGSWCVVVKPNKEKK